MDVPIAWAGAAAAVVRADWWTPTVATPLGAPLLAVPLSALAVRGRRVAGDARVSVETANRALAHVAATYGLLMVSEALRCQGRDYMRERESINLRTACFPTARLPERDPALAERGHAVTVVPLVLLPLVLARFAHAWAPARNHAAVAAFVADLAARLPQSPLDAAYRLNFRLLEYVACTDVAQPPPSDEPSGETAPGIVYPVHMLNHETLSTLIINMILHHRTSITIAPLHTDESAAPLLEALRSTPFRIEFSD